MPSQTEVDRLWALALPELVREMADGAPGSPHFELRRGVLDAKTAEANELMARRTRTLVWAAWATIVVNAALGVVALFS
jgi:hypothetical protein